MFELITGEVLHAPRPHAVPVLATTAAHLVVVAAVIAVPMLLLTEQLPEVPTLMAFVAASPAPPLPSAASPSRAKGRHDRGSTCCQSAGCALVRARPGRARAACRGER